MADHDYIFTLRIRGEDVETIKSEDAELWEEIERDRSSQDSDLGAVMRWLGDMLQDAENTLNVALPIGWYAKVEGGNER